MSSIRNEGVIRDKYNDDAIYRKYFCDKLYISPNNIMKDPTLMHNFKVVHTTQWGKYKEGTKETSASPKTDKIIIDGD